MRRKNSRNRQERWRLESVQRVLFIVGAAIYAIGGLGGLGWLPMPVSTAVWLLIASGGLLLATLFSIIL